MTMVTQRMRHRQNLFENTHSPYSDIWMLTEKWKKVVAKFPIIDKKQPRITFYFSPLIP